jgi:hypothetical protein
VWVSRKIFAAAQGYGLRLSGLKAKGVDGTPIEVVGEGRLDFELWGKLLWESLCALRIIYSPESCCVRCFC